LNVNADLVTYGKVIGGGMPVGAFGGKKEIMQHIAPLGNVYQAGTLSGNPIAMIAGYTLLKTLKASPSIYSELEKKTSYLRDGLKEVFHKKGIPVVINQLGSMISIHFSDKPVIDFASSASSNTQAFNRFFHFMLGQGIYLPPSAFETWFVSHALSKNDIDRTIAATEQFVSQL